MFGERYQYALIFLGIAVVATTSIFFFRELFPEYKIYQNAYVALEEFRSTYSGQPIPSFEEGVKQFVIEDEETGQLTIDRCISCHVALKFSHFSPTQIANDINGHPIYNADGMPVYEANENYIWAKLDQKIADLTDEITIAKLQEEGKNSEVSERLNEAEKLKNLKVAHVGEHTYDMTKVLTMHPLIGRETRPFEYHPMEEYGCTVCHNGNGRGLTTNRAHGPIYDGQYEVSYEGPKPEFLEQDPKNDPRFAKVFNHKPGHTLLFQTNPLFVGDLIQAKCAQCHSSSVEILKDAVSKTGAISERREERTNTIIKAYEYAFLQLLSLLELQKNLKVNGYPDTYNQLEKLSENYTLSEVKREQYQAQYEFIKRHQQNPQLLEKKISQNLLKIVGSKKLLNELRREIYAENVQDPELILQEFIHKHLQDPQVRGTIFEKAAAVNLEKELEQHTLDVGTSLQRALEDRTAMTAIVTDMDILLSDYHRGKDLFFSQACYGCHKIAGLTRGGTAPELTRIGESYPWYIKESIVWPQADLRTSTMPNYHLDHDELEDLMTFLLAQTGKSSAISAVEYRKAITEWEAKKTSFEKLVNPTKIKDLRYGMTVFATEGCAACHRLKGFESNIGFKVEKEDDPSFDKIAQERQWFKNLFPELIMGSEVVERIDKNAQEIDERIVDHVRENSILEEIEAEHPETIESFYDNFKFASRAKNHEYEQKLKQTQDPEKRDALLSQLKDWKERVRRVLMIFIEEYGLGRLIGPRPNWSGIYRSDQWLMEHFWNPSLHSPRSIMPVMPFDNTKFLALTFMLDELGRKNTQQVHQIWENNGFNPERAFEIFCSQCHGDYRGGDGPISKWIYPLPKNLRNTDFLQNLTKERAKFSIIHGVKGTPMPPWGETPDDKLFKNDNPVLSEREVDILVNWIYSVSPGPRLYSDSEDVPKWQYDPKDILEELKEEGGTLKGKTSRVFNEQDEIYYAALEPVVGMGAKKSELTVNEVFEVIPNPEGPEPYKYYIKKKYYTPQNIEAGKDYFVINCAPCHGKEADGSGIRAGTMTQAKPRMLTNLDWSEMRDDLRLIRSIKFGVSGTAMTPWGDLTTSLQRLQLVMFIRQHTFVQRLREELSSMLYQVFNQSEITIQVSRSGEYEKIETLQNQLNEVARERRLLDQRIFEGKGKTEEALELYQKELLLREQLKQRKQLDQILIELENLVKNEKRQFETLGSSLLSHEPLRDVFHLLIEYLEKQKNRFSFESGMLVLHEEENPQQIEALSQRMIKEMEEIMTNLKQQKHEVEGRIYSQERVEHVNDINSKINLYTNIKNNLIHAFVELKRNQKEQQKLYENYLELASKNSL